MDNAKNERQEQIERVLAQVRDFMQECHDRLGNEISYGHMKLSVTGAVTPGNMPTVRTERSVSLSGRPKAAWSGRGGERK